MLRERIITIDLDEGNYRILRYKQYDNNQILKIIIQEIQIKQKNLILELLLNVAIVDLY